MAKHSQLSTNLNDNDNAVQVEKSILVEETSESNNLSNNHASNLPLNNGNVLEKKSLESEAQISKLISEMDLLKKKVGFCLFIINHFIIIIVCKVEEITKENAELKCEMLRQKQPIMLNNENEYGDIKLQVRPVSMYETREGIKCDTFRKVRKLRNTGCGQKEFSNLEN